MKPRYTRISITAFILAVALFSMGLISNGSAAEKAASPAGVWKTIDDNTGKARSHIQIWIHSGKLYGKIVKLLDAPEKNPLCDKCPGKRKNSPVMGMIIMPGLMLDGTEWKGRVLDPESGKWYKVLLELQDGGNTLKVRGYIGISLLGRTQYWKRLR
ncbi:MAG: DUF2147 domain-containing protein [Deltaproteobacteria bacterium]|nr:DUF2147 domain-containing protein [Deltaproteobacteria bacterium]MBN2673401.1 DUF2147 domain-containing protein [Deltaproteobacteria bacterium]